MQIKRHANGRYHWMLVGVGIGTSISVFVSYGVTILLLLISKSQLPEQELVVLTSLFYGVVFFIAFGGMRAESRRYRQLISKKLSEDLPPPSKSKEMIDRIRAILWIGFSVFSIGWITPVLIIYWTAPKHPEWAITACAIVFSLGAGTAYVLKKANVIKSVYNHSMLFFGICLGAFLANQLLPGI